jgi:hypothetical protein
MLRNVLKINSKIKRIIVTLLNSIKIYYKAVELRSINTKIRILEPILDYRPSITFIGQI